MALVRRLERVEAELDRRQLGEPKPIVRVVKIAGVGKPQGKPTEDPAVFDFGTYLLRVVPA